MKWENCTFYPTAYAEFIHKSGEKFTDFTKIRQEIRDQTDHLTKGPNKISKEGIRLSIHSPNVINLTLVDLPGLIKVTSRDQDESIIKDIKELILTYIRPENSLILAVTQAEINLGASDALELAKKVDPECKRTICVLTKLDRMIQGTDACDQLENKLYPLERGYVGVINRSQEDIDANKSISEAIEAESDFIAKHTEYKHLTHRLGAHNLQKILAHELEEHIREKLPILRDNLGERYHLLDQEVSKFKKSHPVDEIAMVKELNW